MKAVASRSELENLSPEVLARRYVDAHREAQREAFRQTGALGVVFGPAVAHVLERSLESVTEAAGEAFFHFEEALTNAVFAADHAKGREIDAWQGQRALRGLIVEAVAELRRRYRGGLPEQFEGLAVIADVEGAFQRVGEEPF